jgi:predicted nucleic acid-binding protein
MIVVDTNVWSEATRLNPSPAVQAWAEAHDDQLWLSSVVLAELRGGAAIMEPGRRRLALEQEFDRLVSIYSDRLLVFDDRTSAFYASVLENAKRLGKPIGTADAMIAATARQHGMAVATRNLGDFAGAGVDLIDPWSA